MTDVVQNTSLGTIHQLLDRFDGFIVDQFGVLHDGYRPYPASISTLQMLMDAGKRVIILSNSGKRSNINIRRMAELGFERSLYSDFVTSGDVAFDQIRARLADAEVGTPTRCLLIARDGDVSAVDGLDLTLTGNAIDADMIIISASESDRYSEQHYIDLLDNAAQRQLPCLCTNPDKLMITRQGILFGAGRIAELYERLGGRVQWIGKPYRPVYEHALSHLSGIDPNRILCIGDSIEHDIAGGANAGLRTLFIRGGIHRDMNDAALAQHMQLHRAVPDYQLPLFC